MVFDINRDGTPDILFSTSQSATSTSSGILRAIRGDNGSEIWTVTDKTYGVNPASGIAVGDLDGDGWGEIVTGQDSNRMIVFSHEGNFLWSSPVIPGGILRGSPAIADLDHDGLSEIVIGATVLNADGSIRWSGSAGTANPGLGPVSVVADLDMDGSPEVIAGRTAYRQDGQVYWNANYYFGVQDGYPAVGNFDTDPYPEIVVVSGGAIYLIQHDGKTSWGRGIPGGSFTSGQPTVADLDGDGVPEIGVAGFLNYVVFKADGSVFWQSPINLDLFNNTSHATVFDFNSDGIQELVFADRYAIRFYSGESRVAEYVLSNNPIGTHFGGIDNRAPVVADVDADNTPRLSWLRIVT